MLERLVKDTKSALRQGETSAARNLAKQALTLESGNAAALDAMALVEAADRNYEQARMWHEKALAAEPRNALSKISFANTLTETGSFTEAKDLLLAAIDNDPSNALAYQRLAWIHKATPNDPLIDALEKMKSENRSSKRMKIKALYALGKWYDDLGEYERAFVNYQEANELSDSAFNKLQLSTFIANIKSIWSQDFADSRRNAGFESAKPAFIVGMPRSGSTLLEQSLCTDPRVASLGERPDLVKIVFGISKNHPRQALYPEWAPDLPFEAYSDLGSQYVSHLEGLFPQAERYIDKTLTNYLYVGFIRAMLPQSLIIEARRHPLDTCLSCYFTDLNIGHNYATDLTSLGYAYHQYADLMDHWRNTLDNVIRVDYESFIQNPDRNTSLIKAKLGLSAIANEHDAASQIKTWSAYQARQPVYSSSIARWKNYEKHLGPLIDACQNLIT